MRYCFTLYLLFTSFAAFGQEQELKKYWLSFSDKEGSAYSVQRPQEFLSPRAIKRRHQQAIPITENDLPVNKTYLNQIRSKGAQIHNVSKWLNGSTIVATEEQLEQIKKLPFVVSTEYVAKHLVKKIFLKQENKQRDHFQNYEKSDNVYGLAARQIEMLNGDFIHKLGYQGEGKLIAVLDGGFTNVDIMPFFDSLRMEGKFYPGYDFVDRDDYVFESSAHGSQVLSVMGSNLPGLFVGSAPKASYVCIITEDLKGEYLVEECNWVAGAEYADSIGADVISSSVGYTGFTDTSMNYDYADMNGRTSRASQAADIAFSKGMILVNSAGNSGGNNWKYIGVPADADKVISVGAVKSDRSRAYFSSTGPTADGRIKPNVAAMGQQIIVASLYSYFIERSNGTSFAAPLVAGMIASLWQAFPEKTNEEIFKAIEMSGDQADNPDNELGYGIPDFYVAYQLLKNGNLNNTKALQHELVIYPNPFQNAFEMVIPNTVTGTANLQIVDVLGKSVYSKSLTLNDNEFNTIQLEHFDFLTKGTYFVILRMQGRKYFASVFKM